MRSRSSPLLTAVLIIAPIIGVIAYWMPKPKPIEPTGAPIEAAAQDLDSIICKNLRGKNIEFSTVRFENESSPSFYRTTDENGVSFIIDSSNFAQWDCEYIK